MKALIIEDELPAARRLRKMVHAVDEKIEILDTIDSVEDAVSWFRHVNEADLVFMDIQLADGLSFDIFKAVDVPCPVIFTTAFDHYAVKAFKVNSLDYLLKPIDPEELRAAIGKFKSRAVHQKVDHQLLLELLQGNIAEKKFKERFLVKVGDQLKYIPVDQVAYFYSDQSAPYLKTRSGKSLVIDPTLDQIMDLVDPKKFFRVSRKVIVEHRSIKKIHSWFNSRLKLDLEPAAEFEVLVSRDRVPEFKLWLDS